MALETNRMQQHKRLFVLWITLFLSTVITVHCQSTTAATTTTTTTTSSEYLSTITTTSAQSKKPTVSCGLNGNTDTICSPEPGDTWNNGTWYPITWNPLYPTYVSSSMLDIYIYFVQNYQNTLIKNLTGINTSKGSIPVLVDDSWRLDPLAQIYDNMVYIVPSGVNPDKELNNRYSDYPPPVHNLVAQVAIIPPSASGSNLTSISNSSNTATMISVPTNQIPITPPQPPPSNLSNLSANKQQQESSHSIQPEIIVAIVLAFLAVIGAYFAVFWFMRHNRKRKLVYGEKGHLVELNSTATSSMFPMNNVVNGSREKLHHQQQQQQQNNSSSISINNNYSNFSSSVTTEAPPLLLTTTTAPTILQQNVGDITPSTPNKQFGFMSVPSLPVMDHSGVYLMDDPNSTTSFSNISSRSEPPLTSTDALLIADTFRQRMRRPDWQQQQKQNQEEDNKRRQLSEELLKNELEAEGTLMKKVGKRAHLLAATTFQEDI